MQQPFQSAKYRLRCDDDRKRRMLRRSPLKSGRASLYDSGVKKAPGMFLPILRVKRKMYGSRLIRAIECTRAEMLARLRRTGYRFDDAEVIKVSQKLDRLINLYYRCQGGAK